MQRRQKRERLELRILLFVSVSAASCACGDGHTPPTESMVRGEVVAELARKLTTDYVLEDVGARMAEALLRKLDSGAYDAPGSAEELASVLTDDLRAISSDKHLGVVFAGSGRASAPMGRDLRNGGIASIETLDGDIGYIEIIGMVRLEESRNAIDAAFAELHDTSALILDSRENGGGDPHTVAFYMSYLSEGPPYVTNRFHFRAGDRVDEFQTTDLGTLSYGAEKPIFVLTSAATFSAGEELAYDIQAQERGLIVGDVTGGGANPARGVNIGYAYIAYIPHARAINPITGTNWEGAGVQPDVLVPAAQALTEARRLAIERLP